MHYEAILEMSVQDRGAMDPKGRMREEEGGGSVGWVLRQVFGSALIICNVQISNLT